MLARGGNVSSIGDNSDMDCASCMESTADRNATAARNETGSIFLITNAPRTLNDFSCESELEKESESVECSEVLVREVVVQLETVGGRCSCDVAVEAG